LWHWVETANAICAIPLAAVGFSVTIWQTARARSAADAARAAAESAKSGFRLISAAQLLEHLNGTEQAFIVAVTKQSPDLLLRLVGDWIWHANQCRGFLDAAKRDQKVVMVNIQKSVTQLTSLKHVVHSFDGSTNWWVKTARARIAIANVTADLGVIAANQSISGGED
jgi:hypothetical protein